MDHAVSLALSRWDEEAVEQYFLVNIRKSICGLTPNTFRRLYESARKHEMTIEETALHVLANRTYCGLKGLEEPADRGPYGNA